MKNLSTFISEALDSKTWEIQEWEDMSSFDLAAEVGYTGDGKVLTAYNLDTDEYTTFVWHDSEWPMADGSTSKSGAFIMMSEHIDLSGKSTNALSKEGIKFNDFKKLVDQSLKQSAPKVINYMPFVKKGFKLM